MQRHLLEAIEQWPRESVWLKVLHIERSQVVANVNVAGSELIIDDSKQQPTSNVSVSLPLSYSYRSCQFPSHINVSWLCHCAGVVSMSWLCQCHGCVNVMAVSLCQCGVSVMAVSV